MPGASIGITGWKGGHLVYQYEIGLSSLPEVSGDGHDHDHGELNGHEDELPHEEMVVEISAGLITGSMALLADGLHMASHTTALGIAVFA